MTRQAKTKGKATNGMAHQQVEVLRRLRPGAAAWVVGVSPRTFRDYIDAPRNEDGTVSAPRLVAWWRSRLERPALRDADVERLAVVVDLLKETIDGADTLWAIADTLRTLVDRHGEHVVTVLLDLLHSMLNGNWPRPSDESEAKKNRQSVPPALQRAAVCSKCGRTRKGMRWTKATPRHGLQVVATVCPSCAPKARRGTAGILDLEDFLDDIDTACG